MSSPLIVPLTVSDVSLFQDSASISVESVPGTKTVMVSDKVSSKGLILVNISLKGILLEDVASDVRALKKPLQLPFQPKLRCR